MVDPRIKTQTTNVVDIRPRRIFVERKCPVKDPRMIPLRAPTMSPFRMKFQLEHSFAYGPNLSNISDKMQEKGHSFDRF